MICPICQSPDIEQNYVQFTYAHKEYRISLCRKCSCRFYQNDFLFDFKENFEHNRNLKTYLEKTSNLEGLITILYNFLSDFPDRTDSGIDIGCGVGIIMDFSETSMGKKMLGFEPSSHYCKEGRENLKLNIIEDFFKSDYLNDEKVDFALCFQVIQMIRDPLQFLREIKKVLSAQGILILSTPDNGAMNEKNVLSDHLSNLSPGVHRFILNEVSMRILLGNAGFKNINIYKKDDQLFVLASCGPLKEINLFNNKREAVLTYYSAKLSSLSEGTSYFKGIWYRLYRNRIDHGEYKEALQLLQEADWFEIWTADEIDDIQTIDKLFELNSSADAVIYYYTGILFLNHLQNNNYAEKFFLLSFLLCRKIIQIQPDMSMIEQDIVWLAKLHQVLVLLNQGKTQEAHTELILMLSNGLNAADGLPQLTPEIRSKAENLMKQIK